MKPLAIDLFCGLGGWTDGLLAEGWDVIGFDIERHVYGEHRYPAQLVMQDVLTLHGSQFRGADLIVASPPCQEYSYMAMPWKKAKAKAAAIRADDTGAELERLNRLFNACFRIQAEASLAAGRRIPMIVENVKGAQPWVGRARWLFGSFALWGDAPSFKEDLMGYTASYSPDDNKIRIYGPRFDEETYARVKAAGFRWAPKQELWVAPAWSPGREDLAIEIAGEIEDEDKSLVQRAEERSERFEDYSENRAADAERARKAVAAIADNIPFGQPILVGHHSEKHARRDAKKIEDGMRRAVNMWKTSTYWAERAEGCLRAAKYKELPAVRARRIKGLEADLRKVTKEKLKSEKEMAAWKICAGINDPEKQRIVGLNIANCGGYWSMSFPLADYPRDPPASQYEGAMGLWSAIEGNVITAAQAAEIAIRSTERYLPRAQRWIDHYENRLTYERAMLAEAGASDLLKPKPKPKLLPLLNYRAPGGSITAQYACGRSNTYPQVDMTKAEYAKLYEGYRGVRVSADKTHRFRTGMIKHSLVCVFLTDSKVHEIPSAPVAHAPEEFVREFVAPPAPRPVPVADPMAADMAAMQATLKAGIKVQAVNQLFPTPKELAQEVAELADIQPGEDVLEPSAGTGMLLGALGGRMFSRDLEDGSVSAVEINSKLAGRLAVDYPLTFVSCVDFLEADFSLIAAKKAKIKGLGFDKIVMNPPFENGSDIKHIRHAMKMLKPGGRLVAICANGPRQQAALKFFASEWRALPPDTFAGTGVNAALMVIERTAD